MLLRLDRTVILEQDLVILCLLLMGMIVFCSVFGVVSSLGLADKLLTVMTGVSLGGLLIADFDAARNSARTSADFGRFCAISFSGFVVCTSADFTLSMGCSLRCSVLKYSQMASVPFSKMYSDGYVKGFPDIRMLLNVGTKPEPK